MYVSTALSNHRYDSGTQISGVTWQTVHDNIVADAFYPKKSLSELLVLDQQALQKWCLSSRHSTACGD